MSPPRPETRYVSVGDADVAYQVVGEGPPDLVYFCPLGSNIDLLWGSSFVPEFVDRVASSCRLILFDRRGTGVSDPVARDALPTWETLSEDVGVVLDDVGITRAAILASAETGPMAILYAAAHPQRVTALSLVNSHARYIADDDYPIGFSPKTLDAFVRMTARGWGSLDYARIVIPSRADDLEFLEWTAMSMRSSATPRNAAAQYAYLLRNIDVRQVLPVVQAPTLVLHVRDAEYPPLAFGRYLAEHIEGAKLVELPGADSGMAGEHMEMLAEELVEFLTGERPVEIDRILTTVLFTDIVGSTKHAATLGDRRWRALLDKHDRTVREQLRRFRGREIKTTGDGFVAAFDGPARAIRCAVSTVEVTRSQGIELRVGMHTGECEVRGDDLAGLAVHIAARVGASACSGEVLVSSTVKDLVEGSGLEFEDRGEQELKGVPGRWRLYAVAD